MDKLTEKQIAFAQAMYTIGLDTFGNGTASARAAGYKGSNCTLGRVASDNTRKDNIIKLKEQIQAETSAKLEHNREIAISILSEALAIARAKKDSAGIVQACRELDAISWLHGSTLRTEDAEIEELSESKRAEARRLANIRLRTG